MALKMVHKKICFIGSGYSALHVRTFYKECCSLAKAGFDVTLIAQHTKNEVVKGVKIIALPKQKSRLHRMTKIAWIAYKIALKQNADVYVIHDPEFLVFAPKLKRKTKSKVVYDVYEDFPKQILSKTWIPKIARKPVSVVFNLIEKRCSKKLDYVVAVTEDIKDNFKNQKVLVVKNYPIIKNFKSTKKTKLNKDSIRLIYAGNLEKERGIKEIVQCLGSINPKYRAKLVLLGSFSDSRYEKEVKSLKEWGKVEFEGLVDFEKVSEHLSKADIGLVCLHPLRRYLTSLPTKMFEYMAAGLPVVASDFPFWRGILKENECGVCVNPLSPKEIASAVEYLIEHPEKAAEMGANGRRAVLEKYNWEAESRKLVNFYLELLK